MSASSALATATSTFRQRPAHPGSEPRTRDGDRIIAVSDHIIGVNVDVTAVSDHITFGSEGIRRLRHLLAGPGVVYNETSARTPIHRLQPSTSRPTPT